MAILTIPTRTDLGDYRFSIELDEVVFDLRFAYNNRDTHWYLDLYDESGTLLRAGVKIVTDFPLLVRYMSIDRPIGDIFAIDPTNHGIEAGLEDLGDSVTLTYVEAVSFG